MPCSSQYIREAFRDSVHGFVEAIERIPPDAWDKPGLGVWSVRELSAHVLRIVDRTAVYVGQVVPVDTKNAAAYYLRALSTPGGSDMVAERARQSIGLLGNDPAAAARAIGERTLAAIDALDDDVSVASPFGTLRLVDYLPTRILELVLHTLDLARALESSGDALALRNRHHRGPSGRNSCRTRGGGCSSTFAERETGAA